MMILACFPFLAAHAQTCDSATWYYVEGIKALEASDDRVAAAANFERALAFDPEHTGALATAAEVNPDKAIEYCSRAYLTDTTDVYLRQRLTRLLLEDNRLDEAAELSPDDVGVLIVLAGNYQKQGDDVRLLDVIKRLMQRDDINGAALFEDITRDREFYRRNYLRLLDMAGMLMLTDPADYQTVRLYAGALLAGGQTEQGLEVYKNYITDTTSFAHPYGMVIDGEAYLRRADSVRVWGRRAIACFPEDVALRLRYGAALSHLGLAKEALAAYDEARRRTPDDSIRSVAHALSGIIYATQNKAGRSIDQYSRAIALDPANALALNNLAYTLAVKKRDLSRALEMSEKSLAAEPLNATYIDTYGYILYRLGRYDEAKKTLRHAMSLQDDPEIMLHYADVLHALGEEFMSDYYRKKALEIK